MADELENNTKNNNEALTASQFNYDIARELTAFTYHALSLYLTPKYYAAYVVWNIFSTSLLSSFSEETVDTINSTDDIFFNTILCINLPLRSQCHYLSQTMATCMLN